MGKVRASEGNVFPAVPASVLNRVMNLGLSSERERKNVIVAKLLDVLRDHIAVCGEYDVKQLSSVKEILEVWRIFLIPKRSRDSPFLTAPN